MTLLFVDNSIGAGPLLLVSVVLDALRFGHHQWPSLAQRTCLQLQRSIIPIRGREVCVFDDDGTWRRRMEFEVVMPAVKNHSSAFRFNPHKTCIYPFKFDRLLHGMIYHIACMADDRRNFVTMRGH